MQIFAPLIDFSQSALLFDLSFQFLILRLLIHLHTVPPSVFWPSSQSTSMGIVTRT
jgi:hypothetical protein